MHRGVPTLIVMLLLVAGMGVWAWRMGGVGRENPQPVAFVDTARRMPVGGWGPMRVMTANIRLDEPQDGVNAWDKRRALLAKTLLKYQPEILACQEESPAQGAYLHRELAAWYAYYPRGGVGTTTAGSNGGGTAGGAGAELMGAFSEALASLNTVYYRTDRFEILDGEAGLVLPNELQANPMENTFFSLAVLRERRGGGEKSTNPGTVVVVDVHLRHTEAFAVRCVGRLREKITAWMEKYPGSGIVLLGDMNWDRTTKVYGALTAEAPPPSVALRDTLDYGKMAVGKGGSYHAFTGQADGAWPTDLIFCGGTFKVVGTAEILRDKGADGRYPTDHFLVEAAVGW